MDWTTEYEPMGGYQYLLTVKRTGEKPLHISAIANFEPTTEATIGRIEVEDGADGLGELLVTDHLPMEAWTHLAAVAIEAKGFALGFDVGEVEAEKSYQRGQEAARG